MAPLPDRNGYKTLDLIAAAELGVPQTLVQQAVDALGLQPTFFDIDRRARYYSPADIQRIRTWLATHHAVSVEP